MKHSFKFVSLVLALGVGASTSSWAQKSSLSLTSSKKASAGALNQSATSASAVGASSSSIAPVVGYKITFFGPSLMAPLDDYTVNTDNFTDLSNQDQQTPLYSRHVGTLGLSLSQGKYKLTFHPDFNYNFTSHGDDDSGHRGLHWNDVYLKFSTSSYTLMDLKDGSNFKLAGNVRFYFPTSDGSRAKSSIGHTRLYLAPSYQIGRSIFSLEAVSGVRWYLQRYKFVNDHATKAVQFETFPTLNAQITSWAKPYITYEATIWTDQINHWSNVREDGNLLTDVLLGTEFSVGNVGINPHLQWYTALPIKTTAVNLELSASL